LVLDNGLVGWVTTAGEVVLAEVQTGQLTARFPGAVVGLPPLLTRDAVLFAGQDGLMMGSLAPAKTQRWMATGWLGPVASPLILADSSVYFATEAKGLIRAGKWK
jgi:hypothetical protein